MPHAINETHGPKLKSWVESANDPHTDFPIQNLPWCVFHEPKRLGEDFPEHKDLFERMPEEVVRTFIKHRTGVRIGDFILDIRKCDAAGVLRDTAERIGVPSDRGFRTSLAGLMSARLRSGRSASAGAGLSCHSIIRRMLSMMLSSDADDSIRKRVQKALVPVEDAEFAIPCQIRDYTDFYASIHHATNVGSMFRPDNPLLPNYKWIPIGYHARASSINISGQPVRRPKGQLMADGAQAPVYAPCKLLDYELELGFFVGPGNNQGDTININEADDHIFGLCLVNDWSARDMQKWEYQPLGPFLAKSFATTISPYIVTLEALAPFRVPAFERPASDPKPLPHLFSERDQQQGALDITLEVHLASKQMRDRSLPHQLLSRGSFKHMYWTIAQMLTHHASNGCNMQPGDLLASGTVSGPSADSRGCLLELTWGGNGPDNKPLPRKPIDLPTGEKRVFLEDGDEVIIKGYCERQGFRRIGFGECRAIIEPAT